MFDYVYLPVQLHTLEHLLSLFHHILSFITFKASSWLEAGISETFLGGIQVCSSSQSGQIVNPPTIRCQQLQMNGTDFCLVTNSFGRTDNILRTFG